MCICSCSLLEQQIKDLGRQVTVLLNEQQRRGTSQPSRLALPAANGGGKLTADDVVSDHLVTFASVQVSSCTCSSKTAADF